MISAFSLVFVFAYALWAYFIARTSSWFYALLTSVLWGPVMHGTLKLYSPVVHASSAGDAIAGLIMHIILISGGGFLIATLYVAPVWGKNRAKWLVWLLMMYPTPIILLVGIPAIIMFHIFDLFYGTLYADQTIRQKHNHVGYGPEDYTLDS